MTNKRDRRGEGERDKESLLPSWDGIMDEIARQAGFDRVHMRFYEDMLRRRIKQLRTGKYDLTRVRHGAAMQEIAKSKWREARLHLRMAAFLEGLSDDHYLSLQPREPGTGNLLSGDVSFTGFEDEYEASKFLAQRGKASYNALVVKMIADYLPVEKLDTPAAIVAKLARLAGVSVTNQFCRSTLKRGHT